MLKNKKINLKNAFIFLSMVVIISLPIILCVVINTFDFPEIKTPFMTIPRMTQNRYQTVTTLFSGNIVVNSLKNFIKSLKIIALQNDGLPWNSIKYFGIIYIFSLPITIVGMVKEFRKEENNNYIINIWGIISFLLLFICDVNINRMNIIIIPLIYYTIIGICKILQNKKYLSICLFAIYTLSFILFQITYWSTDWSSKEYYTFATDLKEVVEYTKDIDSTEKIYFKYDKKVPYIYFLFYEKTNPYTYIETAKKKPNGEFQNVVSFKNYYFSNNINIKSMNKDNIYILPIDSKNQIDENIWNIKVFKKYIIVENEEK